MNAEALRHAVAELDREIAIQLRLRAIFQEQLNALTGAEPLPLPKDETRDSLPRPFSEE